MNQKFDFKKTKEAFNFDDALGRILRRVKIVVQNRGDTLGKDDSSPAKVKTDNPYGEVDMQGTFHVYGGGQIDK